MQKFQWVTSILDIAIFSYPVCSTGRALVLFLAFELMSTPMLSLTTSFQEHINYDGFCLCSAIELIEIGPKFYNVVSVPLGVLGSCAGLGFESPTGQRVTKNSQLAQQHMGIIFESGRVKAVKGEEWALFLQIMSKIRWASNTHCPNFHKVIGTPASFI